MLLKAGSIIWVPDWWVSRVIFMAMSRYAGALRHDARGPEAVFFSEG
jgi:hypothetical protein